MNAQALHLNGQAILYSPPDTGDDWTRTLGPAVLTGPGVAKVHFLAK